jgi:hypothetical protein
MDIYCKAVFAYSLDKTEIAWILKQQRYLGIKGMRQQYTQFVSIM